MYYQVIVACGHIGKGREIEVTRYFKANSAIDAWDSAMVMPRAKKTQGNRCVRSVREIDSMQFLMGKLAEMHDPYLQKGGIKHKLFA